jgi:hypothetical protein
MSPQDKREVMDLIAQRGVTTPIKFPEFSSLTPPPAAPWRGHGVLFTDLKVLAVSDGSNWIRQDTGAAI